MASGGSSTHTVTTTVAQPQSQASTVPTSLSATKGLTINQIYRAASPGVVDITVTEQQQGGGLGFGGSGGQQQQATGEGAGVVYDTKGNILTDEHVVSGATSVKVHFQNGQSASAKVVGTDSSTDVAVIHVDVPASQLHPIQFADSSQAQVGDPVVAIGSPFSLPETTTSGIVSAVGRSITAPNNFTITGAIQTDAAINPGNSGGPLLDASGHVLGLNDQIQTNSGSNAGVGFAIPSNTVARISNDDHLRQPGQALLRRRRAERQLDERRADHLRPAQLPGPVGGPAGQRRDHLGQRQEGRHDAGLHRLGRQLRPRADDHADRAALR